MHWSKYNLNYEKMYSGIKIPAKVLAELKKSDRKMRYCEVDIKQDRFRKDKQANTVTLFPRQEISLECLEEFGPRYAVSDSSPEELLICQDEYRNLRDGISQLDEAERHLILQRYWNKMSQAECARELGVSQQAVSYMETKILRKLRVYLS